MRSDLNLTTRRQLHKNPQVQQTLQTQLQNRHCKHQCIPAYIAQKSASSANAANTFAKQTLKHQRIPEFKKLHNCNYFNAAISYQLMCKCCYFQFIALYFISGKKAQVSYQIPTNIKFKSFIANWTTLFQLIFNKNRQQSFNYIKHLKRFEKLFKT